uniref:synaptic vesicle glycoprotein 2C-like n=1 Tax=Myxine glutinosa TaxID=7769 RepID=UPI00358F5355
MEPDSHEGVAFKRGARDIAREVKRQAKKKVSHGVNRVQDEYTRRSYSRFGEDDDDDEENEAKIGDRWQPGEDGASDSAENSSEATEGHDEDDEIYEGEYQGIPGEYKMHQSAGKDAWDLKVGEESLTEEEQQAHQFELILQECGHGRFQWSLFLTLGLALMADGVEMFVVGFVLPSAEQDMCLSQKNKGWLGTGRRRRGRGKKEGGASESDKKAELLRVLKRTLSNGSH